MGEAKRRGTFEERKSQAVERNMIAAKEREKREMEYRANNPEKNIISVGRRNRSSMLVAVAAAIAAIHHEPIIIHDREPRAKRR